MERPGKPARLLSRLVFFLVGPDRTSAAKAANGFCPITARLKPSPFQNNYTYGAAESSALSRTAAHTARLKAAPFQGRSADRIFCRDVRSWMGSLSPLTSKNDPIHIKLPRITKLAARVPAGS